MYQGNWKCGSCGGAITELPFQPRSETGLTCRTCYAKGKEREKTEDAGNNSMSVASEAPDIPDFDEAELAGEPAPFDDTGLDTGPATSTGDKPRTEGSWSCATCGGAITSLPFTPRTTNNLKCLDCFKKSKK